MGSLRIQVFGDEVLGRARVLRTFQVGTYMQAHRSRDPPYFHAIIDLARTVPTIEGYVRPVRSMHCTDFERCTRVSAR